MVPCLKRVPNLLNFQIVMFAIQCKESKRNFQFTTVKNFNGDFMRGMAFEDE